MKYAHKFKTNSNNADKFLTYDVMSLVPKKPSQTRLFDIYTLSFSFANIFYELLEHDIHETFHVIFHYVIVL